MLNKKRFEIQLDNVVVGSSLEALLYAYYNKYKIIFTRPDEPTQFDKIDDFGLGTDPGQIWRKYMFLLGLAGYAVFSNNIKHIKYIDSNTLKAVTNDESVSIIKFNKLYVFDDHQFYDLPPTLKCSSDRVRIVDWFYVERGNIHEHNLIENKTDFMNQVIFYKSSVKRKAKRKDVCVISYCDKQNLDDYPEHLIKIKTEQLMRDLGIETATDFRTYIKIDHRFREIKEYGRNVYEDFDNVHFIYDEAKFIYEINKRPRKIDYMRYLSMKLGI